jgi:hypothetical protein
MLRVWPPTTIKRHGADFCFALELANSGLSAFFGF